MRRRLARRLASGALLVATAAAGRALAQDATPDEQALLLGVSINGRETAEPVFVLRRAAGLLVEANSVEAWRLSVPDGARLVVGGRAYVALSALPGLRVSLDEAGQFLRLDAPAEAFEATVLTGPSPSPRSRPESLPAAFLSYDVAAETSGGGFVTAFTQAGFSGEWGLLTSTQALSHGGALAAAVRLDTTFARDDPARLRRLTLGDGLTLGSDWIQPVRFAGVRYGSAFDLQPNLITFPTPAFVGRTSMPSTVELYVNDVLRYQTQVEPGPFTLTQAPLVTGAGQVSLQVRDALGVDHAVRSAYYVSPTLLQPGLSEFSVEAGLERRAYGQRSFDYRAPFAAGSLRRGVRDWMTLETRGELGARVQDVGAGAQMVLAPFGEVSISAAVSHSRAGAGGLVRAGFSRISPRWSVSATYQQATPAFRQLGGDVARDGAQVREQLQATAGAALGRFGSVTGSYTQLRMGAEPRTRIASLSYSLQVAGRAFLNLLFLRTRSDARRPNAEVAVSVTIPFGARASAYVQASPRQQTAEARAPPPSDAGWGGQASVRRGDASQQALGATYRGQAGEVSMQLAHHDRGADVRLLVSGAAVAVGGQVTATRQINGGFAIVEIPGVPGVQIYSENRPVVRTDRNGRAVITDLRPYEVNRITLNPADLPIQARLGAAGVEVVPARLGAERARFSVMLEHPATLVLTDAAGVELEAGAPARIDGGEALRVGYDGELFTPTLRAGAEVVVQRPSGPCRARVSTLPPDGGVPRIGPLVCQPMEAAS